MRATSNGQELTYIPWGLTVHPNSLRPREPVCKEDGSQLECASAPPGGARGHRGGWALPQSADSGEFGCLSRSQVMLCSWFGATFGGPQAKGDAFRDKSGESHGLLVPPGVISCVEGDAGIYLLYPAGL